MSSADQIASCPCDFSSWAWADVFLSAGPDLSQVSALQPDCLTWCYPSHSHLKDVGVVENSPQPHGPSLAHLIFLYNNQKNSWFANLHDPAYWDLGRGMWDWATCYRYQGCEWEKTNRRKKPTKHKPQTSNNKHLSPHSANLQHFGSNTSIEEEMERTGVFHGHKIISDLNLTI